MGPPSQSARRALQCPSIKPVRGIFWGCHVGLSPGLSPGCINPSRGSRIFGIDPDDVLAEVNAEIAENTRRFLKRLTEDVALIWAGGTPESCLVACTDCGERKSTLEDFHFYHDPNSKRIRRKICKSCVAKNQRQYIDRDKTVTALRRKLAEIEKASITCNRCQQKKPPAAFPPDGRSCLQCKIEVLESLNQSLREQIVCRAGKQRVGVLRRQARGEYAGKRLQHAISQSDGTLSVEFLGRMFAAAEGKPCPYCGEYMNRRTKTMDHMVPLSKGGVHGTVNVIICCNRCNPRSAIGISAIGFRDSMNLIDQ